jgi:antitoxin VapB
MRAKLFMNGRSQAVRLPAAFRFEGNEVEIERDPETGTVLLRPIRPSLRAWFEQRDQLLAEGDAMAAEDMNRLFEAAGDQTQPADRGWP